LTTEGVAGGVALRISDTGCGIEPALLDQIFDPFFTTKEPGKGTGLGLYNVRTIVTKMRGTIEVESRVDDGTTFTITFPAAVEGST
jgi:signal transduction histidine kinase